MFTLVVNYVRLIETEQTVKYEEKLFFENSILMVDNSFFEIFSFPLVKGSSKNVLVDLNSIVLTESMAKKYFGTEEPLGKILNLNNSDDLTVSGIIKDVPQNSHFHFDFLLPIQRAEDLDNWRRWIFYTYILLKEKNDAVSVKEKFDSWAKKNGREISIRVVWNGFSDRTSM